ncbi:flagellin FliC [bacterium]|nr:flagellin FliC [bacterium]
MGLRIKSNTESLIAQRRLTENRRALGESLERMSSGQRINRSADDAAGLAVSESIRARTRSLDVAKRNANDGISYLQVAEGGLNETTNIIVRMRELAAQAASDTVGNRERTFLDKEFQQLRQEVARIVDSTEFNGSKLLKSDGNKPIQLFVGAANRANDANGNAPEIDPASDPDVLTINTDEVSKLNEALGKITQDQISIVSEGDGGAQDLGPSGTSDLFNRMDSALNSIAEYRATLGSVQSRLNSTITNIEISNENLSAAMSRIRDVDYASETAKFATSKILMQAGVSVLSQANSSSEYALQLLR